MQTEMLVQMKESGFVRHWVVTHINRSRFVQLRIVAAPEKYCFGQLRRAVVRLQMVAHMKRSDLCNCGWWHCCLAGQQGGDETKTVHGSLAGGDPHVGKWAT